MSPVGWSRCVAAVLAAALLSACGGKPAEPGASTAGSSPNAATPSPGTPGTAPAATVPVTTPANGILDVVRVDKCYTNAGAAGGGELLIKASSSDATAHLFAYRPDGTLIGELQNGGGNRYGGTVMPHQSSDPVRVTVRSSVGGSATVPTTPFPPGS